MLLTSVPARGEVGGQVTVDLAAMPLNNLIALIAGAAALLFILAALFVILVKKLGITGIGPLRLEHRGLSAEYRMNEAAAGAEDVCRRQMRQVTNSIKRNVSNIFAEMRICVIARVAISSSIRYPLYESISNNHFTTELTANFRNYREKIIELMRDEYVSLSSVSQDIQCNKDALPAWEKVSVRIVDSIDTWLKRISQEVIRVCEKKIGIYKEYMNDFEDARDKYRADICRRCIEKNEHYVNVLKDRLGREKEKT
jgi:hypothetical protein